MLLVNSEEAGRHAKSREAHLQPGVDHSFTILVKIFVSDANIPMSFVYVFFLSFELLLLGRTREKRSLKTCIHSTGYIRSRIFMVNINRAFSERHKALFRGVILQRIRRYILFKWVVRLPFALRSCHINVPCMSSSFQGSYTGFQVTEPLRTLVC